MSVKSDAEEFIWFHDSKEDWVKTSFESEKKELKIGF
jgi:hypothetical protein